MKKKMILPIAAAAGLLFTSTGITNADAAELDTKVEKNVYVYQSGNFNKEQLNSLLEKYLKDFNINWDFLNKQVPSKEATQPEKPANKPAETQKPAEKPAQAQKPVQTAPKPTTPVQQEKPATQTPAPAPTEQTENNATSQVSAFEQKVVDLTNQERAKQGLPALKLDTELSKVAKAKSQDMNSKGYFSHTSPTYGSPFDMMKQFGISYRTAGENIAMGQQSPEEVVQAWMNSEGHRANILNGSYTHIGVGYVESGNYWTQMFIGK